jgi:thioesterase domain-containing protein
MRPGQQQKERRVDRLERLQETLRHEIPLTGALGLTVQAYADGCLALWAPLAPNINHKATAFAGSLNAALTLAAWGMVWLLLDEAGLVGTIVIQDSATDYRLPVTTDWTTRCCRPEQAAIDRCLRLLRARGRARIELVSTIAVGAEVAVAFRGRYVILAGSAQRQHAATPETTQS